MRLIQVTDCHLGTDTSEILLGVNTEQSLKDVLCLINDETPRFDALLCTGDVANDGELSCYPRFIERVRELFSQPIGWIPGNHDDAVAMADENIASLAESRVMRMGNWQIILLDSSVPNYVHGEIRPSELEFLRTVLNTSPNTPTIVALHHQLVAVGSKWIDKYIVTNAQECLDLLTQFPQVKIVTFGHVHQDFSMKYESITCLSTPSTCAQFKPGCDDFTVDDTMPGYRWFDLNDDGSFTTGVSRIAHKKYAVDVNAQGY